jgi:tetratricopeptide (TPR) repeat protein
MSALRAGPRIVRLLLLVGLLLVLVGVGVWQAYPPILAKRYARRADAALQKQRYAQALTAYQQALRYRPDSPELHLLAARTARRKGDVAAAWEHLHRYRELHPGVTEEQQVEEYLLRATTGEVDEVQRNLMPYVLQPGPLTPLVLETLVRAFMAKYRVELAWRYLQQWLRLEPDNAEALFWLGTWYTQQHKTREAAANYLRVIDVDPERVNARLAYAEILRVDKKFAEMVEQYRAVLELEPRNADAIIGLARADIELGRTAEARELLESLPEDKRAGAEYYWLRGIMEFQADHLKEAEPLLREALARDPRNIDACYNLMLCLHHLGRDEESARMKSRFHQMEADEKRIVELTTAELATHPLDANLRCELGEIYLRLQMAPRALHWFDEALKLDPKCRRAHEQLRDYYDRLGPEAKGRADFHRNQLAATR